MQQQLVQKMLPVILMKAWEKRNAILENERLARSRITHFKVGQGLHVGGKGLFVIAATAQAQAHQQAEHRPKASCGFHPRAANWLNTGLAYIVSICSRRKGMSGAGNCTLAN